MESKICTKCKVEKSTEQFYFDKHRNDFRSHCKYCVKEKRKEYREKNKKSVYKYNKVYSAEYRKKTNNNN